MFNKSPPDAFNTMDKQKHCVKMLRISLFN